MKQNTWFDYLIMSGSMFGIVVPSFVLAPLLVLFFSIYLRWLPAGGWQGGQLNYMVLPVCGLTLLYIASVARLMRGSVIEVLHSDFVRTARAKGASESRVLFVHLLKNAMIPILTNTIIAIPFLITGAFVMERYFSIPGIGDITITAINEGDFPIIKAMTMLSAILFSLFNLITDLLYAAVDPRVKLT